MGRSPCCDEVGLKKGPWTPEEDKKLVEHIQQHGHGSWRSLPKKAGLNRCGKSCRLRWTNYLRPDIKRGHFSTDEEKMIIQLHSVLGNKYIYIFMILLLINIYNNNNIIIIIIVGCRWSMISKGLPGRTDNEIKNYWNTHLKKKLLLMGIDPVTHRQRTDLDFILNHLTNIDHLFANNLIGNLATINNIPCNNNNTLRLLQADALHLVRLQLLQSLIQAMATTTTTMMSTTTTTTHCSGDNPRSYNSSDIIDQLDISQAKLSLPLSLDQDYFSPITPPPPLSDSNFPNFPNCINDQEPNIVSTLARADHDDSTGGINLGEYADDDHDQNMLSWQDILE
ncbi:hypothetical protein ZIOFF_030223 [Zingiber officinale]|uniref:Uncharacterized protein n=1 Tax=Zingiber officinale TaxID=94328 RepID=A0A8J5LHI7_ZINOF|nr:hypothetical protein ZIOFF_030223 [Zingiber officinale]